MYDVFVFLSRAFMVQVLPAVSVNNVIAQLPRVTADVMGTI